MLTWIDAKITVLMVLPPFHTVTIDTQMIEDTAAQYQSANAEACRENVRCRGSRSTSGQRCMRGGPCRA
ncbi:hypothetical protein SBBP2_2220002 [Burkholderiales bacterium]|nr:hypothetical protein SBBP2_2220002 [Burkholderiales bacterium]